MNKLFRLIQFTDSAFPVGTFSFSNGLETAAHLGIVHDRKTLHSYVKAVALQAAFTDGVAALHAFRAANADDYEKILLADQHLILFKLNEEARLMLQRMGKKMAELGTRFYGDESLFGVWLEDINQKRTPGTYPVAQAMAFSIEQMSEQELFTAHQYGVINMVLSASMRCMRISHYETQEILFELTGHIDDTYEQAQSMDFENMKAFVPEMDVFASLHEKGKMRMFMN